MTRYALIAALLMASHVAAYTKGRSDGKAILEARIAQERDAAREATAKLEAARLIAVAERALMAREMEDLAHADPVAVPQCLSPDRVRRLQAIR